MNNVWILARADTNEVPPPLKAIPVPKEGEAMSKQSDSEPNAVTEQKDTPKSILGSPWIFIGLMFVLMYFILFRGPRKKQQQHKQMVQTLAKNDRVRTIGGIIGTVVDIKDDEITLKVDESSNTKIKVVPSAIGRNLSKD